MFIDVVPCKDINGLSKENKASAKLSKGVSWEDPVLHEAVKVWTRGIVGSPEQTDPRDQGKQFVPMPFSSNGNLWNRPMVSRKGVLTKYGSPRYLLA